MFLEVIRTTCPMGYLYLKDIPSERWANAHFPTRRYGHITSNIAELCNATMKEDRKLDPLSAVNEYLIKVSVLFNSRLDEHVASPSVLPKKHP